MLEALEGIGEGGLGFFGAQDRLAEEGVGFVDEPVGFDAGVGLGDAGAGAEPGGARIARTGVNFGKLDHIRESVSDRAPVCGIGLGRFLIWTRFWRR